MPYVLADSGRTRRKQVHWLDTGSDDLLAALRVLNGFDIDLAAGQTRLANRLRDALTAISPARERAAGKRLHQAGVRDPLAVPFQCKIRPRVSAARCQPAGISWPPTSNSRDATPVLLR
jgi:hypothetical protein